MFSTDRKRPPTASEVPLKSPLSDEFVQTMLNASSNGMDHVEFRRRGKEMIDYIADYLTNIG